MSNKNEKMSEAIRYDIDKIINVANELQRTGGTAASTGETIAAAFVINCPEHLPEGYEDMVDAWDRLDEKWQKYVRYIKQECMFRIKAG